DLDPENLVDRRRQGERAVEVLLSHVRVAGEGLLRGTAGAAQVPVEEETLGRPRRHRVEQREQNGGEARTHPNKRAKQATPAPVGGWKENGQLDRAARDPTTCYLLGLPVQSLDRTPGRLLGRRSTRANLATTTLHRRAVGSVGGLVEVRVGETRL